jgi:hypothetical protein
MKERILLYMVRSFAKAWRRDFQVLVNLDVTPIGLLWMAFVVFVVLAFNFLHQKTKERALFDECVVCLLADHLLLTMQNN